MNLVCETEREAESLIGLIQAPLRAKAEALFSAVKSAGSLIVAYSGGVDSSLLAFVARRILKDRAIIAIAVSPSLPFSELEAARLQSEQLDFELVEIDTEEVEKEEYRQNTGNRCFFCKATLFDHLEKLKMERCFSAIAYGANMDDLLDTRPGHEAARAYGVIAPLVQADLYKSEIRSLAKSWGLSSWDRPQAACLSSRFPDFVYITSERLKLVERAEAIVRSAGFRQVRVRFREDLVPVESGVPSSGAELDNTVVAEAFSGAAVANSAKQSGAEGGGADLSVQERGSLELSGAKSSGAKASRTKSSGANLCKTALVEVGADELSRLFSSRSIMDELSESILFLGFTRVIFDPTGYRQGKANAISAGGVFG